ncbi:hypothetical protein EMCRGX_G028111 [Ephydatia muelleri]
MEECKQKDCKGGSTPPPYRFEQPPPYFAGREYASHSTPLGTCIGHPGTANAGGLTIQAEWSGIPETQAAHYSVRDDATSNPAEPIANHYLFTLILLLICGVMCNVAAFCCLVPALFSAAMARNATDSRNYQSAMRWAAVTICLDLLAVLFSVLLGLTVVSYVLYSAAL